MHVEPRDGESFDQLLRRFMTGIDKSGILREYKRKRYFKSNGELQREKAKAAARRRTRRSRSSPRRACLGARIDRRATGARGIPSGARAGPGLASGEPFAG